MEGFCLPTTRRISQPYGAEFDDWDGDGDVDYPGGFYRSIGWDGHNGIDYATPLGDPIVSVAAGVVGYAAWAGTHWLLSGGGNAVLILHPDHAVQTEYLHLSRIIVTPGQRVAMGQVIGYAGKTGAATGYHLHLGMFPLRGVNIHNRMRGRIDPTPYLYGGHPAAGTITTQSTTTIPTEEELKMALEPKLDRVIQLLESFQGVLTDPVSGYIGHAALTILKGGAGTQYVKGAGDDTIYAREDNGKLRGISRPEWVVAEAAGERFTEVPQDQINDALAAFA